ncbi:unnamed protein product, partial [Porites lobata]
MKKIEEIDVGEFYSIRETLCHDLPPDQQVDGVYRNLENFLLLLAKFYFETDQYRKPGDKLVWFSEREGAFKVAIGGDGAPFGKWDQSMSWLILKLATDMEKIESKSYTVLGKNVTFSFDLLPGDMKLLAYINGELSNAAKYFSSFANVSKDDCNALNGKYGESHDCKWKPWQYAERINVAKQVEDFKKKVPSHLAVSTKRSKVTQFIAVKKFRQEFKPLIGKLCDKEVVEPLHLKNNGVQHFHAMLLDLAISVSNLPKKLNSLDDLPSNSAMSRYLKAMEQDVKAGRMKKQLGRWLLEDRAKDKDFTYRLTGKDSRLILHGFMYLVKAIQGDSNDPKLIMRLLPIVFIGIRLR